MQARSLLSFRSAFFLAMALGSAFISYGSLGYFHPEDLHPFVVEKLPVAHEALWLNALSAHVVTAALAFPACLLLLSRTMLRRAPRLHRVLGRITGVLVLCSLVPSGAVLAFEAKGGAWGTAGFLLSGAIIAVAMVLGVVTARARRFHAHRRAMGHVLAQMSVAVTSRALLVVLDASGADAHAAYLVSLWLPVLASAAFVELIHASSFVRPFTVPSPAGGNMRPVVSFVSFTLAFVLLSPMAHAVEPDSPAGEAMAAVYKKLVTPLKQKEDGQSRFSRARMPARDRQVRVLESAAIEDARGGLFFTFALDERHAFLDDKDWQRDVYTGCIYPKTGEIFVKVGDAYRASSFLLGKKAKAPASGVCEAKSAPADTASAPSVPSQT